MQHGVKQTGEKKVSLNLSAATMEQANSKEKKTDDFARVDVLLTMETALDYDDKNKNTAPAERFAEKFGALCRGLDEQKPAQRLGFNWQFYAPFFIEMEKKGHVQALAYTIQAMRAEVSPDVAVWLQQHSGQVAAMVGWAKAYQWPQ
jgi:hypothetical protein